MASVVFHAFPRHTVDFDSLELDLALLSIIAQSSNLGFAASLCLFSPSQFRRPTIDTSIQGEWHFVL